MLAYAHFFKLRSAIALDTYDFPCPRQDHIYNAATTIKNPWQCLLAYQLNPARTFSKDKNCFYF